jgi:NitT/TauT family transport system ATP-binding protein
MSASKQIVHIGFIPLVDAAPLIVAHEQGFAAGEGIDLHLSRETSWATIRDRLAVAHLDAAHALAPLPIAANLGLGPLACDLVVPIALGTGANTITVSRGLWTELATQGALPDLDPAGSIAALGGLVAARRAAGDRPLTFGIVHQHSAHHYQLAYWLAAGGIVPGRDVDLVVVPPSLMPAALASGRVDAFTAGEPWGSVAAAEGVGAILTTNSNIWRGSPEKVLAVREAWANRAPDTVAALVRAIHAACRWCDEDDNRDDLAKLLARPDYLARTVDDVLPSLSRVLATPDGSRRAVAGLLTFSEHAATFPWTSHALWFLTQMVRWGEVALHPAAIDTTRRTFRPDLYRRALALTGAAMPAANAKVEGALAAERGVGSSSGRLTLGPDGFFDGEVFDPDDLSGYIARQRKGA